MPLKTGSPENVKLEGKGEIIRFYKLNFQIEKREKSFVQ